jgi:hypothetical protein
MILLDMAAPTLYNLATGKRTATTEIPILSKVNQIMQEVFYFTLALSLRSGG